MAKPADPRINHQIRARNVRLIDVDGTQLGIKQIDEAIRMAQARGVDLIEIAPQNEPPVCKLTDFVKYRYERDKKMKEARKKQKGGQVKELRIGPKIGTHDLDIKINHMREFIQERDKVRFTVKFRGREMQHTEIAQTLFQQIKDKTADIAIVEQGGSEMEGNRISILFAPKK